MVCEIEEMHRDVPPRQLLPCDACGEMTTADKACIFCGSPPTSGYEEPATAPSSSDFMLCCNMFASACYCPPEDKQSFYVLHDQLMNTYDGEIYALEGGCEDCILAYTPDCLPYVDWLSRWCELYETAQDSKIDQLPQLERCLYFDDGKGAYRD